MEEVNSKYKVLFVCLGNICRSPAAQGIFEHIVRENGMQDRIEADSAGTYTILLGLCHWYGAIYIVVGLYNG